MPSVAIASLIVIGKPVQRADARPARSASSAAVGRGARARSTSSVTTAFTSPFEPVDAVEVELEQLTARELPAVDRRRELGCRPGRDALVHSCSPHSGPSNLTVCQKPCPRCPRSRVGSPPTTAPAPHRRQVPRVRHDRVPATRRRVPEPAATPTRSSPRRSRAAGRVWSYTENHYAPPPPYVAADPFEPYALAAVELDDEGIVVLGQVAKGVRAADLRVGMEMQLAHRHVVTTTTSTSTLVYVWEPACAESGESMSADRDVAILGVGMHPWGSGATTSPSTAWSRRAPRSTTPGSRGPTSSTSPAPTPSATATRASSRARRSRRSSAGPACACRRATRPARRARRRSHNARAQILAGFCDVALVIGADTTPEGLLRPGRRRAQERPRLAALPPARRDQPHVLRALRAPAHGRLRRDERRLRAGQGEELAARAREPERPLPQGEHGRRRARQPDRRRPAAPARHLRDVRRRAPR